MHFVEISDTHNNIILLLLQIHAEYIYIIYYYVVSFSRASAMYYAFLWRVTIVHCDWLRYNSILSDISSSY